MSYQKRQPKIIKARFNSTCKETGYAVSKGEEILYFPSTKSVYSRDSQEFYDFKNRQFDDDVLGLSYFKYNY